MIAILLAAAALRLIDLSGAPPGMTHDEADHGITAWSIVNGARELYFTIGYGREPLYDYATALVMAGTGPTILAARLTSVYFSLLLVAGMYSWTRRAFNTQTALLAAAGLAAGFWPVMAGRQALRSIALPALFTLAVLFFWQGMTALRDSRQKSPPQEIATARRSSIILLTVAGLFLGLSVYTYIPARVMWLAFPVLIAYLWFATRSQDDKAPPQTKVYGQALLVTLLVAIVVALPLILHLITNPGLEVRIDELSAPLRAAAAGDFGPLWTNTLGSLRLFTFEGDPTWRYNIPGKPFLGPLMGLLFYGGILLALWLAMMGLKNPASATRLGFCRASSAGALLALAWLALGIAPVLVTGPTLSMTQAIGAMPVIYLFPALALVAGFRAVSFKLTGKPLTGNLEHSSQGSRWPRVAAAAAVVLFTTIGLLTVRDYFVHWANHPEVRVQYETTMIAALNYLNRKGAGATAVSTITPGQYHTPAVAQLTLHNPDNVARWFDGRQSLLIPGDPQSLVIIPGFTPLPGALVPYTNDFKLVEEIPMRPDDLDRPIRVYSGDGPAIAAGILSTMTTTTGGTPLPAVFGDHLTLLAYSFTPTTAHPGEVVRLITAWRLDQPLPGAKLFAHIVGGGKPIAQADNLGAPGESWVAGDMLLQLHEITLPADSLPGEYPVAVGAYRSPDGERLRVAGGDDILPLTTLTITHE